MLYDAWFPTDTAQEERVKQLERWKERKALEKEKEKRERERKRVFKTGVYQPKDDLTFVMLPVVLTATTRPKQVRTIHREHVFISPLPISFYWFFMM